MDKDGITKENVKGPKPEATRSNPNQKATKLANKEGKRDGGKGKGRRNRRGENRDGKPKGEQINDPSWYSPDPQLTKDAGSISYAVFNGKEYSVMRDSDPSAVKELVLPGVFVVRYTPWYGNAGQGSALNLTMRALYTFVRHVNAGRTNYEAPDLFMYILAMDSIYLMIHEIKRLLRLTTYYLIKNRDVPTRIFASMGINMEDAISNAANYRARLNILIAKANSFAVPANFNLFKRRAVLSSVILSDEPNRTTQVIVPTISGYYHFNAFANTGSSLEFKQFVPMGTPDADQDCSAITKQSYPIGNLLDKLNSELNTLLANEDINIMSGDILKAYNSEIYTIPMMTEDESIEVSHDEDLLTQFMNMTSLDRSTVIPKESGGKNQTERGSVIFYDSRQGDGYTDVPVIAQKNGTITATALVCDLNSSNDAIRASAQQSQIYWNPGQGLCNVSRALIDTDKEPSPEKTIEWTRLMMLTSDEIVYTENGGKYRRLEAGTEIIDSVTVSISPQYVRRHENDETWTSGIWYQFGITTSDRYNTTLTQLSSSGQLEIYVGDKNAPNTSQNSGIYPYNIFYIDSAVKGLSYSPAAYFFNRRGATAANPTTYHVAPLIVNSSENTAFISPVTLATMHDVALMGLVANPFIK